jgi:hypothetical protein
MEGLLTPFLVVLWVVLVSAEGSNVLSTVQASLGIRGAPLARASECIYPADWSYRIEAQENKTALDWIDYYPVFCY